MIAEHTRVSGEWLDLREPADAAARDPELVESLRRRLPSAGCLVIHDLGCGTGSMGRWLAPLLPGPQHWVLHDRDEDLLDAASGLLITARAIAARCFSPPESTDGKECMRSPRPTHCKRSVTSSL